jgi:hypothetical protein
MVSRRAIVMELSEKHLIVLTPSGEFRRVPRSGQADVDIGDEIVLTNRRRHIPRRAWAWTAASLVVLLLFPLVLVPTSKAEPIVAYVTLDVNPSVELGINDEEEVRELRGLNDEGKNLASGIEYKGKNAADVVASLVEKTSSTIDAKAAADHDIVIASVVVGDQLDDPDQFEVQLESDIHEAVTKVVLPSDNVTVISVPKEVREEAERSGVSTGKMAVYLMAKSKNPKLKLDSLKDQSIQEWTASEGGVQSVVPSKEKKVAAASTTPAAKVADSSTDKATELKSKAESNKEAKEALKALLEREKRAKAKREENRQSDRNQSNKPTSSASSGPGTSGQKPEVPNPNKRPNTTKPSEEKDKDKGKGKDNANEKKGINGIGNGWNNINRWNSNKPIINNGVNNSNQQGNSNQNNNQQGSKKGNNNWTNQAESNNSSKGSSGSKNNEGQSYGPRNNNSKNNNQGNENQGYGSKSNSGKNNSNNNSSNNNSKGDNKTSGNNSKYGGYSGDKYNGNDDRDDNRNGRNSSQSYGGRNSRD